MAYYAPNDFLNNPELIEQLVQIFKGNLALDWMKIESERFAAGPAIRTGG